MRLDWIGKATLGLGLGIGLSALVTAAPLGGFDLCALGIGETRSFGDSEHQVTATRESAESVSVRLPAPEGQEPKVMNFAIKGDDCPKLLVDVSQERQMFFIGQEGEGEAKQVVVHMQSAEAGGEGDRQFVWVSDCEGDADCGFIGGTDGEFSFNHNVVCSGEGEQMDCDVELHHGEGHQMLLMRTGEGLEQVEDTVLLRCPEGDTTMRVNKDEAATVYQCPRHFVDLEQVEHKVIIRRLHVGGDHDAD